jgi:predicted TIM-barrel fold metal-dependent hydrolase
LAQRKIPFLSHVGYEFSLIGKDQSAGDPDKLRMALDEGVTVIAAHGCSNGLIFSEPYYRTFLDLVSRYKNFYADVSALTLPNRFGMLLRLRRHPELHARLLFGTDYPLPVFHPPTKTFRTDNRFDRQHLVLKHLGISFRSFEHLTASP